MEQSYLKINFLSAVNSKCTTYCTSGLPQWRWQQYWWLAVVHPHDCPAGPRDCSLVVEWRSIGEGFQNPTSLNVGSSRVATDWAITFSNKLNLSAKFFFKLLACLASIPWDIWTHCPAMKCLHIYEWNGFGSWNPFFLWQLSSGLVEWLKYNKALVGCLVLLSTKRPDVCA